MSGWTHELETHERMDDDMRNTRQGQLDRRITWTELSRQWGDNKNNQFLAKRNIKGNEKERYSKEHFFYNPYCETSREAKVKKTYRTHPHCCE
jgi:hypothetical protein